MEIKEYVETKAIVLQNKLKVVDHNDDINANRPCLVIKPNHDYGDSKWTAVYSMPDLNIRHINAAKEENWNLLEIIHDDDAILVTFELDEIVEVKG